MTYVQYINCDKWRTIIGITLWTGATLGLLFGVYFGTIYIQNPLPVPTIPPVDGPETPSQFRAIIDAHDKASGENGLGQLLFVFSLVGTIINTIVIWLVVNDHYKFIEIRCGVKPFPNEVKHE